jgi:hypothetical protein
LAYSLPTITANEIAAALRTRALLLRPTDIGIDTATSHRAADGELFGVVIETAHPDALVTFVALADGSVSLYVNDGNGCIGCGGHREVRAEAAEVLHLAKQAFPLATLSDDMTPPPPGLVRFYFLTAEGPCSVETRLENINAIDERLGKLYFGAQRVLAVVERVGAGQSLAQEIRVALNSAGKDDVRDADLSDDAMNDGEEERCWSVGNVVRRLRT